MAEGTFAEALVCAAALVLIPHTPGDDHSEPAARKVTAHLLRFLADQAHSYNEVLRLHMHQRRSLRALADAIDQIDAEGGAR